MFLLQYRRFFVVFVVFFKRLGINASGLQCISAPRRLLKRTQTRWQMGFFVCIPQRTEGDLKFYCLSREKCKGGGKCGRLSLNLLKELHKRKGKEWKEEEDNNGGRRSVTSGGLRCKTGRNVQDGKWSVITPAWRKRRRLWDCVWTRSRSEVPPERGDAHRRYLSISSPTVTRGPLPWPISSVNPGASMSEMPLLMQILWNQPLAAETSWKVVRVWAGILITGELGGRSEGGSDFRGPVATGNYNKHLGSIHCAIIKCGPIWLFFPPSVPDVHRHTAC